MKYKKTISTVVAAIGVAAIALAPHGHVGPAYLYPDAKLTPGIVATQDIQKLTATNPTYSQAHRKTTEAMKKEVCKEYSCDVSIEIDHFCPLALGCADDVKNLWAQPEVNMWNGVDYGFHTKDKLEAYLVLRMKAGVITPKAAQDCILQDWVRCYQHYILNDPAMPALDPDQ